MSATNCEKRQPWTARKPRKKLEKVKVKVKKWDNYDSLKIESQVRNYRKPRKKLDRSQKAARKARKPRKKLRSQKVQKEGKGKLGKPRNLRNPRKPEARTECPLTCL